MIGILSEIKIPPRTGNILPNEFRQQPVAHSTECFETTKRTRFDSFNRYGVGFRAPTGKTVPPRPKAPYWEPMIFLGKVRKKGGAAYVTRTRDPRAFPQADEVPSADRSKRWRLAHGSARVLSGVTADDLATLEAAAEAFDHGNLKLHSERLRLLSAKVRAILKDQEMRQIDPDLEALMEAEGLAHRPGPKPLIPYVTFDLLRDSIKSCRRVSFRYESRRGRKADHRTVTPLGFLYGHRHYLVAQDGEGAKVKFYSLGAISEIRISNQTFERDPNFNLREFASRSFGVFEEQPVEVELRFAPTAAPTARQFLFHGTQSLEEQPDGSLIVRFSAGGQLEMAWHLICWGEHVEVLKPKSLAALMPLRPLSWPALP